jgi:carboxyl-terminal processing protease
MVASFAKENRLATIVGTKTAGNVLGAANFSVGQNYWVRLPIFGWMTWSGDCLEGRGVTPDVPVELDPERILGDDDQQMSTAVEIALGLRSANLA